MCHLCSSAHLTLLVLLDSCPEVPLEPILDPRRSRISPSSSDFCPQVQNLIEAVWQVVAFRDSAKASLLHRLCWIPHKAPALADMELEGRGVTGALRAKVPFY